LVYRSEHPAVGALVGIVAFDHDESMATVNRRDPLYQQMPGVTRIGDGNDVTGAQPDRRDEEEAVTGNQRRLHA
jgi:hypothetical protein